ncbi:hypothetical protein [[Mycobacterium] crassicus]|uniref:Uncharacterized protein n=1 Tax=[Mycobacterium] crassicus TaxID=2872309 RepID=A0ABU5XH38_9MYCO|nr:hypothetical protein [Mycolicibacter sp. MYC098]MEB3021284.1 hypothetical protein [Mycolicibacter sp. MYC098]
MTLALFPSCVLPGCTTPVVHVGEPCEGCREVFGPMLQSAAGPALTDEQITYRDSTTRSAYQVQRWIREDLR